VLDQRASRSWFRGDHAFELREMRDAPEPVLAMLDEEVRTPAARPAPPGRTQPPRSLRTVAAVEALAIIDGGLPRATPLLSPQVRATALAARGLSGGCEGAQVQWLHGVAEVVGVTAPYLEAGEIAPVLERLRSTPCAKSLDEGGRRRLDLLQAINARDAAGMAEHGSFLLKDSRASDKERTHFFLSAVTGELARGRRSEAAEIVRLHARSLSPRDQARMIVRLAVAHANPGR
jgi:hypothetical protein